MNFIKSFSCDFCFFVLISFFSDGNYNIYLQRQPNMTPSTKKHHQILGIPQRRSIHLHINQILINQYLQNHLNLSHTFTVKPVMSIPQSRTRSLTSTLSSTQSNPSISRIKALLMESPCPIRATEC